MSTSTNQALYDTFDRLHRMAYKVFVEQLVSVGDNQQRAHNMLERAFSGASEDPMLQVELLKAMTESITVAQAAISSLNQITASTIKVLEKVGALPPTPAAEPAIPEGAFAHPFWTTPLETMVVGKPSSDTPVAAVQETPPPATPAVHEQGCYEFNDKGAKALSDKTVDNLNRSVSLIQRTQAFIHQRIERSPSVATVQKLHAINVQALGTYKTVTDQLMKTLEDVTVTLTKILSGEPSGDTDPGPRWTETV